MKPFVVNRYGRIVFPFNFFPELDFSVFETLEQFAAVIKRDFEEKAPTETDIVARVESRAYRGRYEVLRDLALNLFWVNRYAMTMYEKRPTRWKDVARHRDNLFLPVFKPWDGAELTAAIQAGYRALPPTWDEGTEDKLFRILLDVFRHKKGAGAELPALKPTVGEILANPGNLTYHLLAYDPDYPGYTWDDIIETSHRVPELEALTRQAMVLHNQYRWDREKTRLTEVGKLHDDDFVVVFRPRNDDVLQFIRRVRGGRRAWPRRPAPVESRPPVRPFPALDVRARFTVMPRLEAIAVYKGERPCTNDDLIRNAAYCWSPMTAEEIRDKTGIEQRLYTELDLDHMALLAARRALEHSGRRPEEFGAVLFCSCTSVKMMPSLATWLSAQLGMLQTHASCDLVAACAGLPYGLAEAVRLLQEVERPVLVVCGEKFSDKIGTVRTSRMIFGDGAAALVIGPAPAGAPPDIEVLQTYASGPVSEVDSIIWPNPDFDNNITVYGPEVRALAKRYLTQMLDELRALPRPGGGPGSLLDAVELIVPHQANKTMVMAMARAAGVAPERLYFNIGRVGNTSSASIPIAIHDAVGEGVIDRPMRVFTPAFGAGAVGGYAVLQVDPAVVAR
ncbi:MAG TPA: 3-oxoacyl-[acyl-carrier-protein] synthase III C-terminal domain-containing protein [Methylomirabilota bacterium]|jgi:3-oxoacyl-[acyl-carrier-protein] synthase III|nr:3-oxoacyl-[acyl-carrier-protein] synthase III C-terminal domain-containing protein [Methylomirabilota bacterium]